MSTNPTPAPPIADPEDLLGTYAFLPWLRQGVANAITALPAAGTRASIHVELDLAGAPVAGTTPLTQPIAQDISLYGPSDLLGIDPRAIIRTEPRPGVTNFEANYLAGVDFYDEDFPWRYTPVPPSGLQLSPWIALIVLNQTEFAEGKNIANRPLPFITITDPTVLPIAGELWAWAHVHFNQGLSPDPATELVSPDMSAVLPRVQSIINGNPDLAYSRLLCPRLLDVNTAYDAFVVPAFESGRLAGLGQDPSKAPSATASAWAPYGGQQEPQNYPYYYRWHFRTGDRGDFRYLVSLLKPQPVDPTVGTRDFDVTYPGSNIPGIATPGLNGILRLGGALEVPDADLSTDDKATRDKYENWDQPYPDSFEVSLAKFINLADDYAAQTPAAANAATGIGPGISDDHDPLITSPLYGRWQALTQRLLFNSDGSAAPNPTNWVHRLNLDPRFRVPANYGAEIVEANAEQYMNYAWEQIGDVLQANQSIRRLHFATAASVRLYARHLTTAASDPARVLALTAPVSSRVLYSGATVASLRASASAPTLVPSVLTSTTFRRVLRPGARLMRSLPFTATATPTNLIQRVNAGEVTSAPVKTVPSGVATVDQAVNAVIPTGAPGTVLSWLKQFPWLPWAVLIVAIVIAILLFFILGPVAGVAAAVAVIGGGFYLFRLLRQWATDEQASQATSQAGQTAASVASYPNSSNFVLSNPGSSFVPALGGANSPTAARFDTALAQSFQLTSIGNVAAQRPTPVAIDLNAIASTMVTAVDPKVTILRRGLSMIALPAWIVAQIGEDFNEVMAYPKIDLPMYQPLSDSAVERLLPNINKIATDSITLMETNQRFIEAYMVGLNYEFARKLLWREYPTDQRGSYFRQFWSVGDTIDSEGLNEDALKEKLYDIPEIHRWDLTSALGDHNNRVPPGQPPTPQAVLIVRGELLKKYPNTVIFAQHAKMVDGLRAPDWLTAAEEAQPPRSKTRTPLYAAHPEDDIFFFGFDLTIDEVKGTGGDPGWYFVLQERPGEARFGLEVSRTAPIETFDDVTWNDAMPGITAGQFLAASTLSSVALSEPVAATDPDKHDQWSDDNKVDPASVSSARWAYVLFRQPVMVAVHADEMLAGEQALAMADFASTQAQLAAARKAQDAAQLAALQTSATARQAQADLELATRQTAARGDGAQNLAQLATAAKNASANQAASRTALQSARATVAQATAAFADFSTPQQNVALLNDSAPFVLFPVRIETRFRTVSPGSPAVGIAAVAAPAHQLLVRIYPDDCSIDTFEPMLSQSELTNVKNYWMNIWRAGGVENDQRGAWSNLVAAHGSGRAGWLADNFQPVNLPGPAAKAVATDEILVIPTTTPLAAAEAAAISTYWQSVWLADGDATKIDAANVALAAAVGAAQAAELITDYAPFNLGDSPAAPLTKASVGLSVAFVVFPPDPATNLQSWSQAPQVRQFPERFVVLGFNGSSQTLEAIGTPVTLPLYTGPDPSVDPTTDPTSAIHPDGPDLFVPDQLQWMVDFNRAVAAGMALAIPLTPDQYAAGFTRLLVLGLQLGTAATDGPAALQELFAHHQWSRSGFYLLAQGTPAHNATGSSAGSTPEDDADASFDDRKNRPLFTPVSDPTQKRDGQWLAEFLDLDPTFVAGVHGSNGVDQMQARAMQTALWPATLGYWMDTLFTPNPGTTSIFSDTVIEETRAFFTSFVSGRGALPAIRIGGQPYGILPVTAFSRIQWYGGDSRFRIALSQSFLAALYNLLRKIDADWTTMSQNAAWVGKAGDPHQTLLDLLALNPSSVEYYSRNAESLAQLFNMLNRLALGPMWFTALSNLGLQAQAITLLQHLGYAGAALPDLLNHYFLTDNPQITTIIDDRALSETSQIRAYTDDNRNYIQWLIDAATNSLDTLREETGFTGNVSPKALLYLYLRHALLLGYYNSSYNFHRDAGFLSQTELLAMRTEPSFVHIAEAPGTSESRFAALYKTESRITGSPSLPVSDYIRQQLLVAPAAADLAAQIAALKVLEPASTAELERLFAEHIDTCSYRYDAWLLGLVNQRIASQSAAAASGQKGAGLYLGAYAWVEELHPSTDQLVPVQLPPSLAAQFPGAAPLLSDAENGGYIHAPSIPHANAAAVLRAGFIAAQAGGGDSGELSVNLSSDRVRVALALIEGIRNGQSLGALLGYQFELGLHDDYALAEVDKFIYPLRKAFPLVADAMASTQTGPDVPIEAIEARNVLDGKKLVDQIATSGVTTYPWGTTGLPAAAASEQTALNGVADALRNSYDAIADLALAEGVYQAVQGNYDRVASTIAAYTTGNFPPEPGIVDTAPPGIGLTHRFGIQFRPGLSAPAGATPRAQAEPAIDDWLSGMLPPLDHIFCTVAWNDPVTSAAQQQTVSLADLALRPIDTLYLLKPDNVQAMAELDDRIQRYVVANWNPRPDATVQIQYMTAPAGPLQFSMFESGPLVRNLRSLLTQSRALRASDVLRANDASQQDNSSVFVDQARITTPLASLTSLAPDIDAFVNTTLAPLLADTTTNRAQIIANVDTFLATAVGLLERAARLALPSSGWGFAYSWLHTAFADVLAAVGVLVARWKQKLTDLQNAINAYDALPIGTSEADRMTALQTAELIVRSQLDPTLTTSGALRFALPGMGTDLQIRLTQFQAIQVSAGTSFANLYSSVTALSTAEFDSQPFDISSIGNRAIIVTEDVSRILASQLSAAQARIAAVNAQLATAASAASPADQVSALTAAAKALLGDDFQIIPEFTVSAAQGAEWANAVNASNSGDLFTYLKTTLQIDFPVDEWFYGAARVRVPLRYWESALMLASAFNLTPPSLTPIQLPFQAGAPWLALPFPDTYTIDSDRLLYTCLYSQPFNPGARQCGVLVDEWTGVIPATKRDTAITFNYARPDNEPPQCILLVTSASNTGSWQWADLVGALNETFDLAKKRAVEPAFLDPTAYSRFLPATVTASTTYGITIATALTAANGAFEVLQGEPHA